MTFPFSPESLQEALLRSLYWGTSWRTIRSLLSSCLWLFFRMPASHWVWNPNPTQKGLSPFAGPHNAACRTTGGQVRQSTFRKKSGWSLQAHFKPIRLKLKASELADEGTCQWAVWGKTCFLRVHCGERDLGECRERESVGVLWHVWFINSFSNEYSKTSSQFFRKICADFKN